MNAEEQFDEWWRRNSFWRFHIENEGDRLAKSAFMDAYRLGQLQGMEESAKICEGNVMSEYPGYELPDNEDFAKAIRQAAKELQK